MAPTVTFRTSRVGLRIGIPGQSTGGPNDGSEAVFGSSGPGRYETDDPAVIEHLRNHPLFGSPVGWWEGEDDVPPGASAPPGPDVEALEALVAAEKEGPNRPEVLTALASAIEAAR